MPIKKSIFASFLIIFCLIFISPLKAEPKSFYELITKLNCTPYNYEGFNCGRAFFSEWHSLEVEQVLEYNAKFSHLPASFKEGELKNYEAKAKQNNLEAIFALYQYYKNPNSKNFSDFENEANYWLLKAIELGSEKAMLEMGFKMPYARVSKVEHNNLKAELISNCESISNYKANCFFYRLKIGDANNFASYVIIDAQYLNADTMRPRYLNIVQNNKEMVLELISYNDKKDESRKDYFSPTGVYLGADNLEAKPDYFYNFNNYSSLFEPQIFKLAENNNLLTEEKINIFPFYKRFVIEEEKRQTQVMATFNPHFTLTEGNLENDFFGDEKKEKDLKIYPYLKIDKEELKEGLEEFKNKHGYLAFKMPSIIYYGNLNEYIEKAKNGDLYADYLVRQLYANPLSSVYKTENPLKGDPLLYKKLLATKTIKNPYISLTETINSDNKKISVLTLCDRMNIPFTDNMTTSYENNHCYAMQIKLESNGGTKYHYLMANQAFMDYSKVDSFFIEFRHMTYWCECLFENKKFLFLGIGSLGWESNTELYFDENGDYWFSSDFATSSKPLLKSPQQSGVAINAIKLDKSRDFQKNNCKYGKNVTTLPGWEDFKIEEMEK